MNQISVFTSRCLSSLLQIHAISAMFVLFNCVFAFCGFIQGICVQGTFILQSTERNLREAMGIRYRFLDPYNADVVNCTLYQLSVTVLT
jgi:hypothetical protein